MDFMKLLANFHFAFLLFIPCFSCLTPNAVYVIYRTQPENKEAVLDFSMFLLFLLVSYCPKFQTFSKNVSGFFGSKTSLQVMTVTKSSVSDSLIMLCVHPLCSWGQTPSRPYLPSYTFWKKNPGSPQLTRNPCVT